MQVEDFDISSSKVGETAVRQIDRAVEEARRRDHGQLANEHLFLAFLQVEWDLFADVMHDVGLNPHVILEATEEQLRRVPPLSMPRFRVSPSTKLILKLALNRAMRAGKQALEAVDIVTAVLEETPPGAAASILSRHGANLSDVVFHLHERTREIEMRDERLKKRFELPAYLKQFSTNLNVLAQQDRLAPVFGREKEIEQVLEILCHRDRSNSVMLVGEPGVGKTAIAEGLARRIELEPSTVPARLRNCQIVNLQMNALVAGTMLRGMFEDRLQNVIRELKEQPHLIVFVDEAHTIIGAGSALGAPSDAANVFKSVLARGEIRMIAATTLAEYKEYFLEDEALARRFRCVNVAEPTVDETRRILYSLRPRIERNYSVRLQDEAIEAVLELSPRYMRHLRLPDKAIGWLDTAAVRAEMNRRWEVHASDVVAVVSQVARIPEDLVSREVSDRFNDIEPALARRLVGQKAAVSAVARRLVLNKGPLKDGFDRPDGVLLFLGPTGVGKTELAKATAEFLFGDAKKMIRIDMSEYQEGSLGVDKLIGMPRGIAGSERGGILTNQLRDTPYSVVLLDEVEKASPTLLNLFLQAFDEGWLTDGRGKRVYLSDAVVIMTSNIGSEHFRKLTSPFGFRSKTYGVEQVQGEVMRELERRFSPEFRNRIDEVVLFAPLTHDEVREIATHHLSDLTATLARSDRKLEIDEDALELLVRQGYSLAYGARFLKRAIDERIKLPISARWKDSSYFHVVVRDGELVVECGQIPGSTGRCWPATAPGQSQANPTCSAA